MKKTTLPLNFDKIHFGPSQVWGSIRLVPLIRKEALEDIRISKRGYESDFSMVRLNKKSVYMSYIPHGLVVDWNSDGSPVVAYGTSIQGAEENKAERKDKRRFGKRIRRSGCSQRNLHSPRPCSLAEWSMRQVFRWG